MLSSLYSIRTQSFLRWGAIRSVFDDRNKRISKISTAREMAVLILLVKYIHSKQTEETFSAIVFHLAGVCQLLNEDTVGGHTGIFEIGRFTRQSLGLGAGCA